MKLSKKLIVIIIPIFTSFNVYAAGVFRIINRTYGNLTDPSLTSQIDQLFDTMETEVNSSLSQFDASTFLSGTANATAIANAGSTHDNANRFKYFYLSVGGGFAADLSGKSINNLGNDPDSISSMKGLSGNVNITIGAPGNLINLPKASWFDPEKFKIYFGFSELSQSFSDVKFSYLSYSLMGQYHFLGHHSIFLGSLKWHGFDLTTGLRYSKIKMLFSKTFSETLSQQLNAPLAGNPTMNMSYSTTASLGATTTATSIPTEISSGVGLLYFLDLYAGLAADINFGSASSIINAPGNVTATEASNTLGTMSGDIQFDLGQKKNVQTLSSRYLVGLAYDFRVLSLLFQYNHSMTNSSEGINIGIGAHF